VPSSLMNSNSSVTRTYQMIRVHNGVATVIPCTYNAANQTISCETDQFSTYALAYVDQQNNSGGGNTGGGNENYYTDENEANRDRIEKYYFNGKEGWKQVGGKWYYFDKYGSLKLDWVQDTDGKWYYMNKDGSMATGWVRSAKSGLWYYMDTANGDMKSNGWLCDPESGRWYYLDASGAMCTSWIFVDGMWYLLDTNGAMCTGWNLVNGKWYLLGADGAMLSGWQYVNGKWYYMKEDGECLLDTTTPDGHKVDKDGARID